MRSNPDPVDQPERTAHYDCAICIAEMHTQYYSIETVLLIFPFLQTNITVQMRPSAAWWESNSKTKLLQLNGLVDNPATDQSEITTTTVYGPLIQDNLGEPVLS